MKKIVLILLFVAVCNAQWVQVPNGMGNLEVRSLIIIGNNILAGTISLGVYISTNNGASWTQTSLNNRSVHSFAVNGNYIFAGTGDSGVYLSTNYGTSWNQTSLNTRRIAALLINGNNVFAGDYNGSGVYLSTNNGITWAQTSLNNRIVNALAVSGNNIFAGTQTHGVYISTDNGGNWIQTSLNGIVRSLAVNGNYIFAGTQYLGVYFSTDNGISWTQTSLNNSNVQALSVNGNSVFAGTVTGGVYVSNNNGVSWIQRNEGLGSFTVWSLTLLNNYIFDGSSSSVYRRPLGELTSVQPIFNEIPNQFSLSQNYPNPFNPSTKFKIEISKLSEINITVFDVLGKEVAILVKQQFQPGIYEADWNAANYPSGVYFYELKAGDYIETRKMLLVK